MLFNVTQRTNILISHQSCIHSEKEILPYNNSNSVSDYIIMLYLFFMNSTNSRKIYKKHYISSIFDAGDAANTIRSWHESYFSNICISPVK